MLVFYDLLFFYLQLNALNTSVVYNKLFSHSENRHLRTMLR